MIVDHVGVGFSCTCPSRRRPCKHTLALLLLWSQGQVTDTLAPPPVEAWMSRRPAPSPVASSGSHEVSDTRRVSDTSSGPTPGSELAPPADAIDAQPPSDTSGAVSDTSGGSGDAMGDGRGSGDATEPGSPDTPDRDRGRDERVERMFAGLAELDRWLDDRMRTGLADPALARYGTWDQLAARLVDAQAGSLANRIRRLAGLVGASPDWHSDVLAELGPPPPALAGGSPTRFAADTAGRCGRHDRRLAGAPGRRARRRARHRRVGRRRSQRHPRGSHRGAPGLAARRQLGPMGARAVVRRVPPEPRCVVARRDLGACRPPSLSGPGTPGPRRDAPRRRRWSRRDRRRSMWRARATRSAACWSASRGSIGCRRPFGRR